MFIINPRYIFLCDEAFSILQNKAFVFDERLIEFGDFEPLAHKYPQATLIKTPPNSLILPAFINAHTHLEYSANSYALHYGDFLGWLNSVMNSREKLSQKAKLTLIKNILHKMMKSGTGTIGEISSFGTDLKACVQSPIRVVFFNEILGVNEAGNEAKQKEFLARFEKSKKFKSKLFIPALSLHSTYSTNEKLARFLINLAQKEDLLISAHFLESKEEAKWLKNGTGAFKKWLKFAEKKPRPHYSAQSFVRLFKGQRTLFTHCVWADDFELFDKNLHFITHCAFSNRLLSQKTFALKEALQSEVSVHLGTDGLSSNISLSMLDEMRANLLIHKDFADLAELAKSLLLMATRNGAKALNLELGELKAGKIADFSVFKVEECDLTQLPLQFILNAKKASKLFIQGKECNLR